MKTLVSILNLYPISYPTWMWDYRCMVSDAGDRDRTPTSSIFEGFWDLLVLYWRVWSEFWSTVFRSVWLILVVTHYQFWRWWFRSGLRFPFLYLATSCIISLVQVNIQLSLEVYTNHVNRVFCLISCFSRTDWAKLRTSSLFLSSQPRFLWSGYHVIQALPSITYSMEFKPDTEYRVHLLSG